MSMDISKKKKKKKKKKEDTQRKTQNFFVETLQNIKTVNIT